MVLFENDKYQGTMWISDERMRGGFEIYDKESGGEMYYAEGGLWFDDDMMLSDFDGAYDLPTFVLEYLHENDHLDEWHLNLWCKRLGIEPTTDFGRKIMARNW